MTIFCLLLSDGPRQEDKQEVQFLKSQPQIQALTVTLQNPA